MRYCSDKTERMINDYFVTFEARSWMKDEFVCIKKETHFAFHSQQCAPDRKVASCVRSHFVVVVVPNQSRQDRLLRRLLFCSPLALVLECNQADLVERARDREREREQVHRRLNQADNRHARTASTTTATICLYIYLCDFGKYVALACFRRRRLRKNKRTESIR